MVQCVVAQRSTFVQAFQGSVYELASHPYGCRVLQRCLEHMTHEQTRPLLDEVQKYALSLMQDQFGVSWEDRYFSSRWAHAHELELRHPIYFGTRAS